MRRQHAFLIAFLITAMVFGNWLFFQDFESGREKVVIGRVIDGDTVELEDGRTIRLLNINTEEKGRHFAVEATEFLKQYVGQVIELDVDGVGSYGRTLGRLYSEEYLNLEIVRRGFGHSYLVEEYELGKFRNIEASARESELGIWAHSENYGCLDVEINKYDEYVFVKDSCGLDFDGWTLKDESTKIYKLDEVGESEFKLHSGKGENEVGEYFWGRSSVWNDDNDAIFIRDDSGLLVYYDSYGY